MVSSETLSLLSILFARFRLFSCGQSRKPQWLIQIQPIQSQFHYTVLTIRTYVLCYSESSTKNTLLSPTSQSKWEYVTNSHSHRSPPHTSTTLFSALLGGCVKCKHRAWHSSSPLSTKSRWSPPPVSISDRIRYIMTCQPKSVYDYRGNCTTVLLRAALGIMFRERQRENKLSCRGVLFTLFPPVH